MVHSEALMALTAEIVAAHVENNSVGQLELQALIQTVHGALARLGQSAVARPEQLVPAISVRSSVKADAITCLDCGAKLKLLKRHLTIDHGLTPAEYRARWNLKSDYPMVSPSYSASRKELAHEIGLGRKPRAPAVNAAPTVGRAKNLS